MYAEISYTNQELVRLTSNHLDETIYSIVAFKVDAFYVFIIKEILNKSTS